MGEQTRKPIPRNQLIWIAENLLSGCAPDTLAQTLIASGLDAQVVAQALQDTVSSPVLQAARNHQQITRKLESVVHNQCKLAQLDPGFAQVPRRSKLSADELFERYFLGCRPVIVTDLMDDWPQVKSWTPAYLRQHFGDVPVQVQYGRGDDPLYEQNKRAHQRNMLLGEFIDEVLSAGNSNNLYLTGNNEALKNAPLARLLADIGTLPPYLVPETLNERSFLWMGPQGTVTPLHHDEVCLFHLQVVGRKRWRLISPMQTPLVYNYNQVFSQVDLESPNLRRFPLFSDAVVLDVVVNPGEAIFLPLAWWHHVRSLDISISLSFSNLRVPGRFEYENPRNAHW